MNWTRQQFQDYERKRLALKSDDQTGYSGVGAAKPECKSLPALEGEKGREANSLAQPPWRSRVRITQYRKRPLDEFDNLPWSCKEIIDGLKTMGAIYDDCARWLECSVYEEVVPASQIRTEIEITKL